jgi:LacI family transcriptional regulator
LAVVLGSGGAFVGIDNRRAGEDAARWAIDKGLSAAALIHAPLSSSATRDRVAGIRAVFAATGLPLPDAMVLSSAHADHLEIGQAAARSLIGLDRRPGLVICTSDLIAFGVARAWREGLPGQPIPRIFGFDDSPLNEWLAPDLSSVRIPYQAFGQAIVATLLSGQPQLTTILPHRIIERGGQALSA